jgi:Ca2+/Na+ antiporter
MKGLIPYLLPKPIFFHDSYHIIGCPVLVTVFSFLCSLSLLLLYTGFTEVIAMMLLDCIAFYLLVAFYSACRMEKPYQMDLSLFHLMDCFPHYTEKVGSSSKTISSMELLYLLINFMIQLLMIPSS